MKPTVRPANPNFSSGPCTKRPGWTPAVLADALVGRSHRSAPGKEKLAEVIARSRRLLGMPEDWRLAIVPASDTGAVEIALWSLLGARGVDVLAWESFGAGWALDVRTHLGIRDVRLLEAGYGALPDLSQADSDRDLVFVWNGTTSGVCLPDGDWIAEDRRGLAICDATSAVFAIDMPWSKLDIVTWSWQKAIGGEGAHGMLALGPRAVERLLSWTPPWPLPKVFRLTRGGALVVWQREFILAARAAGKGAARISAEHVLPNVASLLIVQATIQFALAILAEAGLSYLGLGTQPPQPSWGKMLNEAQTLMFNAPQLAIFPGLAIALTVLGLNLFGDGLRDLLDPRLRRQR